MDQRPGFGLETWAEAVLETPFNPALYQPEALRPPHRLLPVQIFAQKYLAQEFPAVCRPDTFPGQADVAAIQQHIGQPALQLLRNYVGMAHNMAEASNRLQCEVYESQGLQARAEYQYATTKTILDDLQMVRVQAGNPKLPPVEEALQTGVVVVAPCGFGKTWVGAHAMAAAGVGRRLHPQDPAPVQGLVVVPSIDRLYEYGEEDESNIFRKIIGMDVPVGLYYGQEKNIQPVTVITEASLRNVLESGTSLGRTGVILFDEIHHGTSPKNMTALKEMSGALVGLTATPARSQMRDIRRHFPHVEVGSLRKFTELGILNSARLLTYRAPEGELGMEQSAATLAVQWLRQGRRVVVYAPRQREAREDHATDRIANEINRQMGQEVVGAARSIMGAAAQETVQHFRKKRLQGIVTVNMISVGSNVEADTLVLCGPAFSETAYMQRVGRAMRPTDKETILAEIWPHVSPERQMVTLAMLFGIENYRQGMLIGTNPEEARLTPQTGRQRVQEATDTQIELSALPPMTPQEIRSYFVGNTAGAKDEAMPEGYLNGVGVMRRYNSTEEYIRKVLDEAGVYYRKKPGRPGVKRAFWYGPEAVEYLDQNPPMEVCGDTFQTFSEVSEMLDIPEWLIQHICDSNNIQREDKLIEQLAQQKCLSDEAVNQLVEALYELPYAEIDKDVHLDAITDVVGRMFANEYMRHFSVMPRIMRFAEESEMQGYGYFLTHSQAEEMLALHAIRDERSGLTSLKEIAKRTGNTVSVIESSLEPEEESAVVYRRASGQGVSRLGRYIANEHAEVIIEREKLVPLPNYLVARPALTALFDAPRSRIFAELVQVSTPEYEHKGRFTGNRTITTYVRWDAVRVAAGRLPLQAAFSNLNFERLRSDLFEFSDDEDMARADQLYARLLQATLMPWYEQDSWHSMDEAALAMHSFQSVIDAFCGRDSVQDNPELMRMSRRRKIPIVHFKALVPAFKAVMAAPQLSFSAGWRSHGYVVSRVISKGTDPKYVKIPTFSGNREDMLVGREPHKGHKTDIIYSKLLAERIIRRAMEDERLDRSEAERAAARRARGIDL